MSNAKRRWAANLQGPIMPHFKCWSVMSHSHDAHSSRPWKHGECALYTLLFHLGCTKHDQHMWAISVRFAHPFKSFTGLLYIIWIHLSFHQLFFQSLDALKFFNCILWVIALPPLGSSPTWGLGWMALISFGLIGYHSEVAELTPNASICNPNTRTSFFHAQLIPAVSRPTKSQGPVSMSITAASFWGRAGVRLPFGHPTLQCP